MLEPPLEIRFVMAMSFEAGFRRRALCEYLIADLLAIVELLARNEPRPDLERHVVEERDAHEQDQKSNPDLLTESLCALGQRAALQPLDQLEYHLSAIEDGNGQEI